MRSLLIVQADGDGLTAALAARPSAIVFDLGGLAEGERDARRRAVADLLRAAHAVAGHPRLLVRLAPLPTELVDGDLAAILGAAPEAVILPNAVGLRDVERLGAKLAVAEAVAGLRSGSTGIVAVAGDTARGALALGSCASGHPRLRALAFDGAAFGDPASAPFRAARATTVLAAMAAGVPAIDLGPQPEGDLDRAAALSRRDGFSGGLLARHPGDVARIESSFSG